MERKNRTGIYLSASDILNNPDYVETLRDEIGLNLVIMGYSGTPSHEVLERSPFDTRPVSDACVASLSSRHLDGTPLEPEDEPSPRAMVGPGLHAGGDDAAYREAIQALRQVGMEIWICLGSWTGRSQMFCPSKRKVDDWFEALYVHGATDYDVDGIDLTHARFPMCSCPRGMFACTCDDCASEAAAMGYDMEEMKSALRAGLTRLSAMNPLLLKATGSAAIGPFDFLQWLGMRRGVLDWFRFRADLVGAKLKRLRDVVKQAAGAEFVFGSDTYPSSLAMFVGHDQAAWAEFSDFASPLVSHISSFTGHAFVALTRALQNINTGLSETEAFQLVYAFTGYAGMGLPETVAGFELERPERLGHILPVEELVLRDLRKARLLLPEHLPCYPIIHGTGWPRQAIDAIVEGAAEAGHDGIVWQGTDEIVDYRLKN